MPRPAESAARTETHGLARALIALAVVALVAVRKHDSFTNPQLWAEDGGLFLIQGELHGWGVLFTPYEGYLHFFPRVIAALARGLPLGIAPVFYATVALVATGLTAWIIQSPRVRVPGTWAAALAIGAIPHTGEVYLTLCNLQWITALALFALTLMDDATTPAERVGDITLLVITGLTGPFVILVLPFFAWRAWRRRSRWSLVLLGLAMGCAAAHVPSLLHRPVAAVVGGWAPWNHAAVIGRRLFVSLFFGEAAPGIFFTGLLGALLFLGLAALLWQRRRVLPDAWLLLVMMAVVLAATAVKARPDIWSFDDLVNGDRYFFIPKILMVWLLAALAAGGARTPCEPSLHEMQSPPRAWRILLYAILVVPLFANATRFIYPPFPPQNWRHYAAEIERGNPTMVPILPEGFKFWHPGRHPR